MQQQGIMFNGETPMMSGTWYNPSTGDSFIVRNTFFEDNQLVVQTMDGRMLKYNQLQHYVQSDGSLPQQKVGQPQFTQGVALPPEVSSLIEEDGILADDLMMISGVETENKPLGNLYVSHDGPTIPAMSDREVNDIIISKALDKYGELKVDLSLDKNSFPKETIKMLVDVMGIDPNNIAMWYIAHTELSTLHDKLRSYITEYINEMFGLEGTEMSVE